MPHSLVLNLISDQPLVPGYLEGRHMHALFLSMLSSFDPELGTRLHAETLDKAFTLSPLQFHTLRAVQSHHVRAIPPETPCWWRISLLDDRLFGHLTPLWLNLNPKRAWHLGSANLLVTSVLGTVQSTQSWARALSYKELYEQASDTARHIDLRFYTPTSFRQGEYDMPMPAPAPVFASLINRWQKYSGIELADNLKEVAYAHVFPCAFNLRTEMVPDRRSKFIGCVGEASYQILGDVESIHVKQLNVLADFAMFCGVGRKTPMGMGMVQRVRR